jgi:hypothetical protein
VRKANASHFVVLAFVVALAFIICSVQAQIIH